MTSQIEQAITLLVENPGRGAREIIENLPRRTIVDLAVDRLLELARDRRRSGVLHIEREAAQAPTTPTAPAPPCLDCGAGEGESCLTSGGHKRKDHYTRHLPDRGASFIAGEETRQAAFWDQISSMTSKFAEGLRMEWTRELLAAEFALPDGTLVPWGEATAAQHDERKAMLERNAGVNIEAAARHEKALQALAQSGSRTLNEAVAVAA